MAKDSFEDAVTRELARLRGWLLEQHQCHTGTSATATAPTRATPRTVSMNAPSADSSSDSEAAPLPAKPEPPSFQQLTQRRKSFSAARPSPALGGSSLRRGATRDLADTPSPGGFKATISNTDARRMSRAFHLGGNKEPTGAVDGRNRRRTMTEHPDSDTMQSKILALQDLMKERRDAAQQAADGSGSSESSGISAEKKYSSTGSLPSLPGPKSQSVSNSNTMTSMMKRSSLRSTKSLESDLVRGFEVLPIWQGMKRHRRNSLGSAGGHQDYFSVDDGEEDLISNSLLRRFMIAPGSPVQVAWDLLGLLLLAWDCVWLPLQIVAGEQGGSDFPAVLSWTSRVYWTLYMFTSCVTGYFDSLGRMELRPHKVLRRYMSTWLVFDSFLGAADWLDEYGASAPELEHLRSGSLMRSLRIVRTVRLLRMMRAPQMLCFITDQIPEELILVAHMCKVMGAMVLFAHFLGCAWYGIGEGDAGWVHESGILLKPVEERYLFSVHWSVSVFAGETLIAPANDFERMFTVVALIFSMIFSAAMVSSITTAMTRLQMISSASASSLAQLRKYLRDRQIKARLCMRVQRNAQHVLAAQKKNVPEENVHLLKLISNPLMVELHFEVYSRVLLEHAFMSCFCNFNPAGVRKVCHGAMAMSRLSSGDVLFSDSESSTKPRMFFVAEGCLEYAQKSRKTRTLQHGASAAEPVLWTNWSHCGTMRATAHTDLIELDAQKFQDVLMAFPMGHVGRYAEAYVEVVNLTDRSELDDTGEFAGEYILDMLAYAFPELAQSAQSGVGAMATRASGRLSLGGGAAGKATESKDGFVLPGAAMASFRPGGSGTGSAGMRALSMKKHPSSMVREHRAASAMASVGGSIRGWLRQASPHTGNDIVGKFDPLTQRRPEIGTEPKSQDC